MSTFFRTSTILILFILFSSTIDCVYTLPAQSLTVSTCENSQSKMGVSTYYVVFGFLRFGDGSITTAMNNGSIDSVHHVDIQTKDLLFVKKVSTLVVGSSR